MKCEKREILSISLIFPECMSVLFLSIFQEEKQRKENQ